MCSKMKVLHSKVILGLSSFEKCASFFLFFPPFFSTLLLLSDTALSSDFTLWLGLSQYIHTTKAWAVTIHSHQQEHQGLDCHNTLTPARPGQSQYIDTGKAWAITIHSHQQKHQGLGCHNILKPARTLGLGLSEHINTSKKTRPRAVRTQ